VFVGLGNGITLPSCNAGALSVRPKLAGTAAGLNGAATVAMGAVLTTLSGFMLSEQGGAFMLLMLMLLTSLAGLACALWASRLQPGGEGEG
ncbi:MAG: Bcr/CflA family drug resistance efflux transporter, partial [Pseudomonadota bacterium]